MQEKISHGLKPGDQEIGEFRFVQITLQNIIEEAVMSCENCLNLKVGKFSYGELRKKWAEIYSPTAITEGYEKRLMRESLRRGTPLERTKLKFVYCSKGMLSRFYIIRGNATIKPKAGMQGCQFYA